MYLPDNSTALPPEMVHLIEDAESGLEGAIVLHSSRLGPAAGGCRLWTYSSRNSAVGDAMRLAEGMACKNALAGLPLGGGKAVLRLPQGQFDRTRFFAAFGREVEKLKGAYVTAEDVGTNVSDMQVVRGETRHVAGLAKQEGKPGGDPSPWTARGVFVAMQASVRRKFGSDLRNITVAVQGLGHVGSALCAMLHDAGAKLIVSEPRAEVAASVACLYGAMIVPTNAIATVGCEVFAPCALGAVVDRDSAQKLRASVVCGAANNILARPEDGDILADRDILYAPDYVVNAGGIINVCAEYFGWPVSEVEHRVQATGDRLTSVFDQAEAWSCGPHRAADRIAHRMLSGQEANILAKAA